MGERREEPLRIMKKKSCLEERSSKKKKPWTIQKMPAEAISEKSPTKKETTPNNEKKNPSCGEGGTYHAGKDTIDDETKTGGPAL